MRKEILREQMIFGKNFGEDWAFTVEEATQWWRDHGRQGRGKGGFFNSNL